MSKTHDIRCGLAEGHQGDCIEDPDDHDYEVIVGNIGTVYTGNSPLTAKATFAAYKQQSISGVGRAGGEPVTLMKDGEPFEEFLGADEVDDDEEANPAIPHCDQCQMLNINGKNCHEIGCPNRRKKWDTDRQQWIAYHKCSECGDEVEEGESCNCREIPQIPKKTNTTSQSSANVAASRKTAPRSIHRKQITETGG